MSPSVRAAWDQVEALVLQGLDPHQPRVAAHLHCSIPLGVAIPALKECTAKGLATAHDVGGTWPAYTITEAGQARLAAVKVG